MKFTLTERNFKIFDKCPIKTFEAKKENFFFLRNLEDFSEQDI